MRRLLTTYLFAFALGAATFVLPANATAASANQAVVDCNAHGRLTHTYTPDQLRTALDTMPADIKEYTDCYDLIQRTLLAELGGQKSAGAAAAPTGSGGSFLPTPLLVVIAVLAAVAVGFAALALRRRRRTRLPPAPPISEA